MAHSSKPGVRRVASEQAETDPLRQLCNLYDVVRVDADEATAALRSEQRAMRKAAAELATIPTPRHTVSTSDFPLNCSILNAQVAKQHHQLMCNYLPMVREALAASGVVVDEDRLGGNAGIAWTFSVQGLRLLLSKQAITVSPLRGRGHCRRRRARGAG